MANNKSQNTVVKSITRQEQPTGFFEALRRELSYAITDIRQKVVEEGWFGRVVTPPWKPSEPFEKTQLVTTTVIPDGGIHGKATVPPVDPDGGVHGKAAPPEPWMKETGGFEALNEGHKQSAERSYHLWSTEKNPEAARRHDIGSYVKYVQGKWADENRSVQTPARSPLPEEARGVGMSYAELKASWGHQPDQAPDRQPEKQPAPEHSIDP